MSTFSAPDGTRLAFHRTGVGDPLVCLPGGPLRASAYLGDLGGLADRQPLLRLDPRGSGCSGTPTDPSGYPWDRQVDDLDALRAHLGLHRLDLLAHSAGAALALGYAARHPDRVRRLVLVAPSTRAVDLEVTDADRRAVADLRRNEPWFPEASAALHRIADGAATAGDWDAITPFTYGRWDEAARAHAAADTDRHEHAAAYYDVRTPPERLRADLRGLTAPVLLLAGEYDVALPPPVATRYATLFAEADLVVQPGAGHFPWLDDPARFTASVHAFTIRPTPTG